MNYLFFEEDPEYPDFNCGEFAAKRYLRLIDSADYCSRSDRNNRQDSGGNIAPLPPNLLTEGRVMTSALRAKIAGALVICPLPSSLELRTYQLFHLVKFFGWRYNYKFNYWEQDWNCR
jgi:hypothetical protein